MLVAIAVSIAVSACASESPSPSGAASTHPSASEAPSSTPTPSPSPSPTPEPTPVALCPLTGLPVSDPAVLTQPTLLVQVENHWDARPPLNLIAADLVIEAPVEGDVTRYSALYLCNPLPSEAGPIRSARYYNVDLWQQMHVLTVCFGASTGAQARFRAAGMPIVNGITGLWPWFFRGAGYAPHNLYGDLADLRAAIGQNQGLTDRVAATGVLRPPFVFSPLSTFALGDPVGKMTIWTNRYWHYGWRWDTSVQLWQRMEDTGPLTDRSTGEPIRARNVIVQVVQVDIAYGDPDPGGNPRRELHLVGAGTGYLYVEGTVRELRWSRPSADAVTSWTYAATGDPVVLRPGRVWWEIIGTNAVVNNE